MLKKLWSVCLASALACTGIWVTARSEVIEDVRYLYHSVDQIYRYGEPYGKQEAMGIEADGFYGNKGNADAYVTFYVESEKARTAKVIYEYGSPGNADQRAITYWVNGQEERTLDLTPGNGWIIPARTEPLIVELKAGRNEIKFGNAKAPTTVRGIYVEHVGGAVMEQLETDITDEVLLPGESKEIRVFAVDTDGNKTEITSEATFTNVSPKITVEGNKVTGKDLGTGVVQVSYDKEGDLAPATVRFVVQEYKEMPPKGGGPIYGAYLLTFFSGGLAQQKKVPFYMNGEFGGYSYNNIDNTREVMKNLHEAGIEFVILDMTNSPQWTPGTGSFTAIENIETVAGELGMKISFLLGGTRDNGAGSFNQRAKYIWENYAQKDTYLYYEGKPLLMFFTVNDNKEFDSFAPEAKDYIEKFNYQAAARTEYGYRSMATDPEGKVRYVQPNPGIDPKVSDWGRISPREWRDRVVWASQATDLAIIGGYDDLHDGLYWGIADSTGAAQPEIVERNGYHLHHPENTDPWDYYNIVKDVLVSSRLRALKAGDNGLSDWAVKEINAASLYGLTTEKTTADFQKAITREAFCELAVKLYEGIAKKEAPAGEMTFTDTTNPEIAKAVALGVTEGVGDGLFAPDTNVTREQMVTMLLRTLTAAMPELETEVGATERFVDDGEIGEWALPAVDFFLVKGIVKGDDGKFLPKQEATCEAAIAMVRRVFDEVYMDSMENHTRIANGEF